MSPDSDAPHLYFRVDASTSIGTGHFMRCLSLAQYWRDQNRPVSFIGNFPESLSQRLSLEKIATHTISAPHPDPADLDETASLIPENSAVVIDGYHFDESFQRGIALADRVVLVIDDTGHLDCYAGRVLLNQNVNAAEITYEQAPELRLLGTQYALLNRAFRRLEGGQSRDIPSLARHLLVTLGGADPNNDTSRLLNALASADLSNFEVRVVAGGANAHQAQLRDFCDSHSENFSLIVDTDNMPELMQWADLAIAASGSTCWELAYLGVPGIYVAIAPNQEAIGQAMAYRGAGVYIGRSDEVNWSEVADAAVSLSRDPRSRSGIRDAATSLVDGDGVVRVAASLMNSK